MITILKTSGYERERDKFVINNIQRGNALIKVIEDTKINLAEDGINSPKISKLSLYLV